MKKIRIFGLILLGVILCAALTACAGKPIGITLNTDNVQKKFTVGDEFNYDGLVVTAVFNKGKTKEVDEYTVSKPNMATAGVKTVTVTYKDKTADYLVNVTATYVQPDHEHVLESITLNTDNVATTFFVGDAFNYDGLVVTAHYKTEPLTEVITDGYSVSTPDMSKVGEKTITVMYFDKSAEYTINVKEPEPRALQSISLNVAKVKRSFTAGDEFSCDGLVVTANYNVAPLMETVTDYVVNEDELDMSVIGQKTVIVSYQGKTASYEIIVNEPVLILDRIELNTDNVRKTFFVGDAFTVSGLVVTAYYENGEPQKVTDFTIPNKPDMTVSGTQTVTVDYQGKTASYEIEVREPTLTSIVVDASGAKTVFTVGDEFTYEGIVVTARFSNQTSKQVTDFTVPNKPDMTTAGTKTVTVDYQGKTATYDIEVKSGTLERIEVNADQAKKEFYVGDAFTSNGIVVTAYYSDESSEVVTNYTVSQPDMSKAGQKTVTVTYQEMTAQYTITVEVAPIEAFPEEYNGTEIIYEAEQAVREGSANVQTSMGSGGAFVGNIANGDKITFAFKSSVEGTVELYLAISHGNNGLAKAFDVYVNGEKACSFDVSNSGGWQTIKEFLVCKVQLKVGLNVVEFNAINTRSLVNIDYMKVVPSTGGNEGGGENQGDGKDPDENKDLPTYDGTELKLALDKATLSGNSTLSNSGFIQAFGGSSITFTFNSTAAASVDLRLNLASKTTNAFDIYVNGELVFSFNDTTGSNGTYKDFDFKLATLIEGENTIEIRASEANGSANGDNFNLKSVTITPAEE